MASFGGRPFSLSYVKRWAEPGEPGPPTVLTSGYTVKVGQSSSDLPDRIPDEIRSITVES